MNKRSGACVFRACDRCCARVAALVQRHRRADRRLSAARRHRPDRRIRGRLRHVLHGRPATAARAARCWATAGRRTTTSPCSTPGAAVSIAHGASRTSTSTSTARIRRTATAFAARNTIHDRRRDRHLRRRHQRSARPVRRRPAATAPAPARSRSTTAALRRPNEHVAARRIPPSRTCPTSSACRSPASTRRTSATISRRFFSSTARRSARRTIEFLPLGSGRAGHRPPRRLTLEPGASFHQPPSLRSSISTILDIDQPAREPVSAHRAATAAMFSNVNVAERRHSRSATSQFLFDTGADVTVVSELNAVAARLRRRARRAGFHRRGRRLRRHESGRARLLRRSASRSRPSAAASTLTNVPVVVLDVTNPPIPATSSPASSARTCSPAATW